MVYHYTSNDTLYKIIENQSIWLTDLRSSMDKNELDYAENLIKEMSNFGIKDLSFMPTYNFYALSCTSYRDSYFHFNNYGDNCNGVAIGINTQFMRDGLNEECERQLHYHLKFRNVIYEEVIQKHILNMELCNLPDIDFLKAEALTRIYNLYWPIFKRPEFVLENEIRFLYEEDYGGRKTLNFDAEDPNQYWLDKFMLKIGLEKSIQMYPKKANLKESNFGNRKRHYYEMSLIDFGINNFIKEIIVGPKFNQDVNELQSYLNKKSVNAKIYKSKIELRD